jgi:transposase-like protein
VGQNFLDTLKSYAEREAGDGLEAVQEPEEKLQVVLAVLRGEMTQVEAARRLEMSQTTIAKWQKQFLEGRTRRSPAAAC